MKWDIIGRSVRGAAHVQNGVQCQDSSRRLILPDSTVILAVADGHGSKRCIYSKSGSRIAANAFCAIMERVVRNFTDEPDRLATYLHREGDIQLARDIDREWKLRVRKRHKYHKREIPSLPDGSEDWASVYPLYGTTLLGLMLCRTFLFAYQLGDGDIGYVDADGYRPLLEVEKILGVETHSLCQKDSWTHAYTCTQELPPDSSAAAVCLLSTDGFANSYPNQYKFRIACAEYFQMLCTHGSGKISRCLPQWLWEVSEQGCGDDVTLLLAYHPSGENEEERAESAAT